ncbi:ABC transporter substrate-binding protein [Paractinoplanes atraurantiacus]|uniref:NitT/TauT family transport system substrate-binding protein n=1 Tax=Paractinoplanes atraurantiacus TaxID=1036182 RepID=A0A285KDZ8_9ACTN|nr:ABC transporter substrate-binding protein [Actinoplanes atraurantiacus]SNY70177.1 NitT/TauT family transport system substrate-binding protein [Actinoplanes atraurantiacus]
MRRIVAAAVVFLLLATAACSSDDKGDTGGGTKVTVGVVPIVDVAPIYLGKAKGFFASRGIDLTLVPEQGGSAIVKNVVSGKYPFGFSNVTSLMAAQTSGAQLKGVAAGVSSTGRAGRDFSAIVVHDGSPIRSAKDLTGKTIAVNTLKNLGDTTVRQSVRSAGGDPANLKFEAMPFGEMPAALQGGRVDAAWVVEPQLSQVLTQGGQIVASNFVDTAANLTVALYFTSEAEIAKSPDLVTQFTAAIKDSMAYAGSHPDEVRDIVGTYTTINDTVRIAMILPSWPGEINRPSIDRLAQLGRRDGILTKAPALDQLLP